MAKNCLRVRGNQELYATFIHRQTEFAKFRSQRVIHSPIPARRNKKTR
jgi:hypothetical protein